MPEIVKYKITEPYLDLDCGLGEAPFWDKARDTLRFVDISKKKLHTIKLSEGPSSHQQIDLKHSIGTTADIEGNEDEFVFGGKYGGRHLPPHYANTEMNPDPNMSLAQAMGSWRSTLVNSDGSSICGTMLKGRRTAEARRILTRAEKSECGAMMEQSM